MLPFLLVISMLQPGPAEDAAAEPAAPEPTVEDDGAGVTESSAEEYGPFFEEAPPSDTAYPTKPRGLAPRFSVGNGTFCFVEDAHCKASLLLSGDLGIGLSVIGENGPDIPYAQFTARGGFTVRPFLLAKGYWHPWTIGLAGGWSIGTGGIRLEDAGEESEVIETDQTESFRLALVNQLWLSHKKNAMHLDFALGAVRSDVIGPDGTPYDLWGTHAEIAFGFGGWGALVASADFLDQDTRIVFGFRLHGIAAAPAAGLTLAGLAGGGKL